MSDSRIAPTPEDLIDEFVDGDSQFTDNYQTDARAKGSRLRDNQITERVCSIVLNKSGDPKEVQEYIAYPLLQYYRLVFPRICGYTVAVWAIISAS